MRVPSPTAPEALISLRHLLTLAAGAALILFSSTNTAGAAAAYVYENFLSGLASFQFAQKSVHVAMFAAFGTLCYLLLPWQSQRKKLLLTILACFLLGTASEIIQLFTGRDPSVADAGLNLFSGTVAALISSIFTWWRQ